MNLIVPRIKHYTSYFIIFLTLFFLAKLIFRYIDEIVLTFQRVDFSLLFLVSIFFVGYFYARALSFYFLLRIKEIGQYTTLKQSLMIWFLSELSRVIPGGFWSFGSRYYLAKKNHISAKALGKTFILEILFLLVATSLLSLPFIISYVNQIQIGYLAMSIGGILILSFLFLRTYLLKIVFLFRSYLFTQDSCTSFLLQFLGWIFFGVGNGLLFSMIYSFDYFGWFFSLSLFVWLLGYLSFITPMGLGVREGLFIFFLLPMGGIGEATFAAVLSRLLLLLLELGNGAFWVVLFRPINTKLFYESIKSNWDKIILIILILLYIITFSTLSILRHNAFASSYDLGNMDNTIWNTLNGRFFAMTSEINGVVGTVSRIQTHADFILIFLSPLYLIWDDVRMLLLFKSVVIALGAIPTYLLSMKILRNRIYSLIIVFTYLLNPGLQWSDIYDFHGVSFAIPFLITTFYFMYVKKWRLFWLFYFLALITKEQISLYLLMLGIGMVIFFRERLIGSVVGLISLSWFIVMIFILIPSFSDGGQHWAFNDWFSSSKKELISSNGSITEKLSFMYSRLEEFAPSYFTILIKQFGYVPLLGFPFLFLSFPEFMINILSKNDAMRTIQLHYDSAITPSLIIATIFGIHYFSRVIKLISPIKKYSDFLTFLLIVYLGVAVLRVNYHYSPLPTTPSCWCFIYNVSLEDREFEKVIQSIPKTASVTASSEIRPHLTHRFEIFNLPMFPYGTDYVALIDQDRSVGGYNPHHYELAMIEQWNLNTHPFFNKTTYALIYQSEHFYLFKEIRDKPITR